MLMKEGAWTWFLGFTTIGGLTHFRGNNICLSKAIWFILFIAGICATIWQIYSVLINYFEYNVITSVTNDEAQTMNFPAVTICNANRVHCGNLRNLIWNISQETGDNEETLKKLCGVYAQVNCDGGVSLADMITEGSSNPNDICPGYEAPLTAPASMHRFFILRDEFMVLYDQLEDKHKQIIAHQPDKMFRQCTFESLVGTATQCKELLNGTVKVYHPHFGYCYTFNGMSTNNHGTITPFSGPFYGFSVEINIEQLYYMRRAATQTEGIIVSIHHPKKDPLLVTNAMNILTNTLTRLAITEARSIRQPYPYTSNCTNTWNRTSMPHLDGIRPYQSGLCQTKCLYDIVGEMCNCSLNQLYTIDDGRNQKRICLIYDVDKNCTEAAAKNLTDEYLSQRCICPSQCEDHYYDVSFSSAKWPSQVFWPHVADTHQIRYSGENIHPRPIFDLLIEAQTNVTVKDEYDTIRDYVEGNFLKLEVYFANKYIRRTIETQEFPLSAILSSIGGAISLWVGASFITLFELVELGLRLLFNCYFVTKEMH
ncbi:acid-sensing ion channel 4-A-like [Tigriopus californicus]|uniref:acid-sensing ion channel 4-A-like n=1 Tax=Tigriopus californicus TaxID=6832 RepID=UPI0027DA8806|nr:acid-sensing ion channel 4-A-like [Tigriopus californicus]